MCVHMRYLLYQNMPVIKINVKKFVRSSIGEQLQRFSFLGNSKFYFQFNFVGRILGPRGLTAKQLEQETGCKVMVRGKGSMRDKKKVSLPIMTNFAFFSV